MAERKEKAQRPVRVTLPTRTSEWERIGLEDHITPDSERSRVRELSTVAALLAAICAVVFLFSKRSELFPENDPAVKIAAILALAFLGWELAAVLSRSLAPRLLRRIRPGVSGVFGFLGRLLLMLAVLGISLRIAGVQTATLAASGAATVIVLGVAAQSTLSNIFAGLTMLGTRPFKVGERVRLQAGSLAGEIEGVVAEQGLFYTTLREGADRIQVPNSVIGSSVIIPIREPWSVDVLVSLPSDKTPGIVESALTDRVDVPLRYPPHCSLEEIHTDRVLIRIKATPVSPDDGARLSELVLETASLLNENKGSQ